MVIDQELNVCHFGHDTQTVHALEVEAGTHIAGEGLRVLEILGVLIVLLHDVRAVVVVELAIARNVGVVQTDLEVLVVAPNVMDVAQTVALGEVDHRIDGILTNSIIISAQIAFGLGVEIGVISAALLDGLAEFAHGEVHSGQRVALIAVDNNAHEARVADGIECTALVGYGLLVGEDLRSLFLQNMELRHEVAGNVGSGLGVLQTANIAIDAAREHGVGLDGAGGNDKSIGGDVELVGRSGQRVTNAVGAVTARSDGYNEQRNHCDDYFSHL